jgi:adenylate cyclase
MRRIFERAGGLAKVQSNRDAKPIVDWLIDGALSAPTSDVVLTQLCERLVETGAPLWRAAVFVRTLHPEIMGRRFLWREGGQTEVSAAPYATLDSTDYLVSPVAAVMLSSEPFRRRMPDAASAADMEILVSQQAQGATDYLAVPMRFTDGSAHVASFTTRAPAGFDDETIEILISVVRPLARVAEIRALRRTADNLLDAYVGRQAGSRILAGKIRRGHAETIQAVIWYSDMRGFTSLSDRTPARDVVALLNDYFDCQTPAIIRFDGEVLKYMGDGLLAVFPASPEETEAVCRKALAAAQEARAAVAKLPNVRFGLALHVGEVLFGNIGGGGRLDFTCIGPAVNLAARIEKVAAKLGETVVTSAAFASACPQGLRALGPHALAGIVEPQEVFAVDERAG